jgi:hypothetical protein
MHPLQCCSASRHVINNCPATTSRAPGVKVQKAAALQHLKPTAKKQLYQGNPDSLVLSPEIAVHGQQSLAKKHMLGRQKRSEPVLQGALHVQ